MDSRSINPDQTIYSTRIWSITDTEEDCTKTGPRSGRTELSRRSHLSGTGTTTDADEIRADGDLSFLKNRNIANTINNRLHDLALLSSSTKKLVAFTKPRLSQACGLREFLRRQSTQLRQRVFLRNTAVWANRSIQSIRSEANPLTASSKAQLLLTKPCS